MEIKELISFYINESTEMLEVTFRLLSDSDDEIRTGQIEISETENFGYDFLYVYSVLYLNQIYI